MKEMTLYRISNRSSGQDLGTYSAIDAEGALDAMARDAGYWGYREAVGGVPGDLLVEEVPR